MTKLEGRTTPRGHAAAADPIRDQERYERMRQAQGDLRTNRPRGYVDKSGLKQYNPKYLEMEQPREQDPRVSKEPAVLSVNQTLNPAKRGGGREEHHNGFSQAKAARTRETSHRQAAGYMDGGMLVHELTTSTALQARVPADKNVRRKEKPYRRILNEQQSAAQDSGNTVDKNLRIYGDAHKPVVRLNRLVRIPGVMAKRGVGDTDLYDASRPHKVGPRIDRKKDANSKKGVRRDYGHYTNQLSPTIRTRATFAPTPSTSAARATSRSLGGRRGRPGQRLVLQREPRIVVRLQGRDRAPRRGGQDDAKEPRPDAKDERHLPVRAARGDRHEGERLRGADVQRGRDLAH